MDPAVLRAHGVAVTDVTPASVAGLELVVRPRVNLHRSPTGTVFGSIAQLSDGDVAKLYAGLQSTFGLTYLPTTVTATTRRGDRREVVCYIATARDPSPADPRYVAELASCVRKLDHPEWYARHIESFMPAA